MNLSDHVEVTLHKRLTRGNTKVWRSSMEVDAPERKLKCKIRRNKCDRQQYHDLLEPGLAGVLDRPLHSQIDLDRVVASIHKRDIV